MATERHAKKLRKHKVTEKTLILKHTQRDVTDYGIDHVNHKKTMLKAIPVTLNSDVCVIMSTRSIRVRAQSDNVHDKRKKLQHPIKAWETQYGFVSVRKCWNPGCYLDLLLCRHTVQGRGSVLYGVRVDVQGSRKP